MMSLLKKVFRISQNGISSSGRTDTGRVRSHNEDNYSIMSERHAFVVADGMGGHNAGEVASQVSIEALDDYYSKEAIRKIKGNKEEIRHFLIRGFHHTNEVVMRMAQEDTSRNGMGCTLVSCLIDDDLLHTCHVGDARCYVSDRNDLEQLTTDHSAIAAYEERISTGDTTESKSRPPRQVITRAIGFPFPEDPEYHCREIRHGHRVLLCSDGLWSMVDDKQIHEILISAETPQKASDTLVLKANEAGGTDNITAVVIFC
jgi:serine/threonine protein phosphatase PrpC